MTRDLVPLHDFNILVVLTEIQASYQFQNCTHLMVFRQQLHRLLLVLRDLGPINLLQSRFQLPYLNCLLFGMKFYCCLQMFKFARSALYHGYIQLQSFFPDFFTPFGSWGAPGLYQLFPYSSLSSYFFKLSAGRYFSSNSRTLGKPTRSKEPYP